MGRGCGMTRRKMTRMGEREIGKGEGEGGKERVDTLKKEGDEQG